MVKLNYTIAFETPYLRVKTAGVFDYLEAFDMWRAIVAACEENDCFDVIGISEMNEPVPDAEVKEAASLFRSVGITPKHRIAWVTDKPDLAEPLRIAETVLDKRSPLNARLFETVDDAKRWLENGD